MIAYQTPTDAPRWKRWALYSAPARIVIFVAITALLMLGIGALLRVGGYSVRQHTEIFGGLVRYAMLVCASLAAYLVLVRLVEKRRPAELALRLAPAQLALGIVAGAGLMAIVVALMWLAGSYEVVRVNAGATWWPALLIGGVGAAVFEEILFRGVIFRILEESRGTWVALIVSALLFGGVHLANPGSTLWSAAAIAIEAGLLFGILYNVTRSLWACIGLHMAWNFTQGTVWGIPVSGFTGDSFLVSSRTGPDWLTGSAWGAEGSVLAVFVCLLATLTLMGLALRRGTIVARRPWFRPKMEATRIPEPA